MIDEFVKYSKELFGYDLVLEKSDVPDTFQSLFGAEFIEQEEGTNAKKTN